MNEIISLSPYFLRSLSGLEEIQTIVITPELPCYFSFGLLINMCGISVLRPRTCIGRISGDENVERHIHLRIDTPHDVVIVPQYIKCHTINRHSSQLIFIKQSLTKVHMTICLECPSMTSSLEESCQNRIHIIVAFIWRKVSHVYSTFTIDGELLVERLI